MLLQLAQFGKEGQPEVVIPKISQESLAEMVGTTRSRVSFFMNRFRKLGFIEYDGAIKVHSSLLNVVLHDRVALPLESAFADFLALIATANRYKHSHQPKTTQGR